MPDEPCASRSDETMYRTLDRRHVEALIAVFAPGGGSVFCQVHNI